MEIATSRFGPIEAAGTDLFVFPAGLIGREELHRWVLLNDPALDSAVWLQSADRPEVAYVAVDPRRYWPDCRLRVARQELAVLGVRDGRHLHVLTIVSPGARGLTVNLKAPLVLDVQRRLGCQVICQGEEPLRMPLPMVRRVVRRSA